MSIFADAATAAAALDALRKHASTVPLPPAGPAPDAYGDGRGMLLVRDRNVVILVRDHGDRAGERVEALREELVTTAPRGVWPSEESARDRCGRLVKR